MPFFFSPMVLKKIYSLTVQGPRCWVQVFSSGEE